MNINKTSIKKSFKQAGATAIETLGVIAVIAIIILYAGPKVIDLFTGSRQGIIIDDIAMIFYGAESKRGSLPVYTGITCDIIRSEKHITRPWTSCTAANPYQGDYTFTGASGNPVVTATGLPAEFCTRVADKLRPTSITSVCASGTLTVTQEG